MATSAIAEKLYPVPGRPGLFTDGSSLYFDENSSGIAKKLYINTSADLVYEDGPAGPNALRVVTELYRTAKFASPEATALVKRFVDKHPPTTTTPPGTLPPPPSVYTRVDATRWPKLFTDGRQMFWEKPDGTKIGMSYKQGPTPGTGKLYFDDGTEVPKDSEAAKQMSAMYTARPSLHPAVQDFLKSYPPAPTTPTPTITPTVTPTVTPTTPTGSGKPHRVEAKATEFKSVVKVLIGLYDEEGKLVARTHCTGVVTEHGEVATAKHCFRALSADDKLRTRRPIGIVFDGQPPIKVTGFDADKGSNDFMFVKYDKTVSERLGIVPEPIWPNPPDKAEFAKLDLEVVGFPVQKSDTVKKLVSKDCRFNGKVDELGPKGVGTPGFDPGYSGKLWDTNCPAWFGSSGGPVFATKNGRRYLVGIVTHSFDFNEGDGRLNPDKRIVDAYGDASITTNFSPTWTSETIKAKKRDSVSKEVVTRPSVDQKVHF